MRETLACATVQTRARRKQNHSRALTTTPAATVDHPDAGTRAAPDPNASLDAQELAMADTSNPSNLVKPPMPGSTTSRVDHGGAVHQQPLTDRLAQGAHHAIDHLADAAAPKIERMEGAVADATGKMKDQARHARQMGDEWADSLRETVQRNPLTALVAAAGIGALIARIARGTR